MADPAPLQERRREDPKLTTILELALANRRVLGDTQEEIHRITRRMEVLERTYGELRRVDEMLQVDQLSPREAARLPLVLQRAALTDDKANDLARRLRFWVAVFAIVQGLTALGLLLEGIIIYLRGGHA